MTILINIYAEQEELEQITRELAEGEVAHSEIHDAITASSKLNNPLSSPDLLMEMLKFTTAALQATGAIVVLYTAVKQALKRGKKIILIKEGGGASLEVGAATSEDELRKFIEQ